MIIQAENPVVEVHNLSVTYHNKPVLWEADFSIPAGNLVGILGPNGAGKTTLIKAIMNLVDPSSGYVKLFDRPLDEVRPRVSYVPQKESVDWDFPTNVLDVVLMGRFGKRGFFRSWTRKDKEIALACLEKVGMQDFQKRQISQLSGGQQQRVFLARSLAQEADLYFMDEPFAGIDAATEDSILKLLLEMRSMGKTLLIVHHDLQSAFEYFDWFVFLNTRLVASGPKAEVFNREILQETYGSKLTLLHTISNLLTKEGLPMRDETDLE